MALPTIQIPEWRLLQKGGLGYVGSSYWIREAERLGRVLNSNSLGTDIRIQDPVLLHNPVAVGPVFFLVLVPGLAPFPFPNPGFQQLSRL